MKKKKKSIQLIFHNTIQPIKKNRSFNDYLPKRLALSCRNKNVCIIKKNNVETQSFATENKL